MRYSPISQDQYVFLEMAVLWTCVGGTSPAPAHDFDYSVSVFSWRVCSEHLTAIPTLSACCDIYWLYTGAIVIYCVL